MGRVTAHTEYGTGGVASGAIDTRTAAYNPDRSGQQLQPVLLDDG
jgi:hypothetical protein